MGDSQDEHSAEMLLLDQLIFDKCYELVLSRSGYRRKPPTDEEVFEKLLLKGPPKYTAAGMLDKARRIIK
jgi:hypothetical protein